MSKREICPPWYRDPFVIVMLAVAAFPVATVLALLFYECWHAWTILFAAGGSGE